MVAFTESPDDIPLRRKDFAAATESFAEKIEEMLLGWEEAAVTGELKETALSSLVFWQVWEKLRSTLLIDNMFGRAKVPKTDQKEKLL